MTRLERSLLLATFGVLVVAAGAWLLLREPKTRPDDATVAGGLPTDVVPLPPRPAVRGVGLGGSGEPIDPLDVPSSGAVPPGLREPTGEDLSDPQRVLELLRTHLGTANPRWDTIAELLGVLAVPLDADIRDALRNQLLHGNAAGAIQAYQRVRDGTVAADLLRALDDRKLDLHDRNNVLVAISTIPGADLREIVTGIEARLDGDFDHDGPYLQAIARLGGREAIRALADAVNGSRDPTRFGPEVWRAIDLKKDKDGADHLATVLRAAARSEKALVALLDLAGRPGATPDLVAAMLELDVDTQPESVRRAVLPALAKTGADDAIARLVTLAEKNADYASVAARAIASTPAISEPARVRLLETAKTTTNDYLRQNIVEAFGHVRMRAAVPLLMELVGSGSDLVKKESVRALGRIGPAAESAVAAIVSAYGSGDEVIRQNAIIALAQIGSDEARRTIEQARASETSPLVKRTIEVQWQGLQSRNAK